MDYETSSQARSWLFDRETLNLCHDMRTSGVSGNENGAGVRNFASGLHRRIREQRIWDTSIRASLKRPCDNETPKDALSETEKAAILRFHGNQIQALVGPRAIYPDLKTSPKVLATAIMLYRRFYLSNDVLDSDCRHIATASALLASKVEPDEQIDVSLVLFLFMGTWHIALVNSDLLLLFLYILLSGTIRLDFYHSQLFTSNGRRNTPLSMEPSSEQYLR